LYGTVHFGVGFAGPLRHGSDKWGGRIGKYTEKNDPQSNSSTSQHHSQDQPLGTKQLAVVQHGPATPQKAKVKSLGPKAGQQNGGSETGLV
jgi:hypothetical protein